MLVAYFKKVTNFNKKLFVTNYIFYSFVTNIKVMVHSEKLKAYKIKFQNMYPDNTIYDKSHEIVIMRGLIMYFLYKENEVSSKKVVTFSEIAKEFQMNYSSVIKSNQKIKDYILNCKVLSTTNNQRLVYKFKKFYYQCFRIFNENQHL